MCSTSGPILAEINPEGIGFKKYRCKSCGKQFKASGKYPECPGCGAENLELA